MRRFLLAGFWVLLVGVLSGCASAGPNFRLYSEARDKQGEAVKDSWSRADAKAVVVAQRESSVRLLKEELDAQDRIGLAIRDQTIRQAAFKWTGKQLVDKVEAGLNTTVGDATKFGDWEIAYRDHSDETAKLRLIRRSFDVRGLEVPACEVVISSDPEIVKKSQATIDAWDAAQTEDRRKLGEQYAVLIQQCRKIKAAADKADNLKAGLAGDLGAALTKLSAAEVEIEGLKNKHQVARNTLRVAQAEYDAALAKTKADPSTAKNVAAAAEKVGKALDALSAADDAFSLKLVSEARRDSIDSFFSVLNSTPDGKPFPEDAPKAAVALKVIPELSDKERTAWAEAKKPLLVPLVMRKNYEQLNVEALSREIAAKEARIEIVRSRFEMLRAKGLRLSEAKTAMAGVSDPFRAAKLYEVDRTACKDPAELPTSSRSCADQLASIHSALARYFDAMGRLDTEARKAEFKLYGARYEEALALAEVNVLQWDALIGTSVDQLALYGKTGIKAEHILALVNSLTLLWIGVGVN